jgi:uncharacterized protein DUF268
MPATNGFLRRFYGSGPVRGLVGAIFGPPPAIALMQLGRYVSDYRRFRALAPGGARLREAYPCLMDATRTTGFDPHYFYQAAWLARQLARDRPDFHVDFGSSIGTIGVTSGFVPTIFVDLRPVHADLCSLASVQADLTKLPFKHNSLKSASCLHVVEHVGLGRYGDSIDPAGHLKAARALVELMAPGGRLYISTPVGRARVCFNAHRIFNPSAVTDMFGGMQCVDFSFVDDSRRLRRSSFTEEANNLDYGCGLFLFQKVSSSGEPPQGLDRISHV